MTYFDKELTQKETEIIDKFIDIILKNKRLLSTEKELDKAIS